MSKQYLLKTKRLGIRLLDEDEIKHIEKLAVDEKNNQEPPHDIKTNEQFNSRIKSFITQYRNKALPSFVVYELASGNFTGGAGFSTIETGEIEIGYVFHKKYWGNGYATETLDALLKWAKKNIKAEYIVAYTVSEHVAAQRVLDKCGMTHYKTDSVAGVECRFYRLKNK